MISVKLDFVSFSALLAFLLVAYHKQRNKVGLRDIHLRTFVMYFINANTFVVSLILLVYGAFGWPISALEVLGRWPLVFAGAALFKVTYDAIRSELENTPQKRNES